jgi:transglutaminase-like putative cysteine protease
MSTTDLEISHETRYAYGAPVSLAHHLAHLRPLDDAHQQLLSHELITEPEGDTRTTGTDSFGNACTWLSRALPHDELLVRTLSQVRVGARFSQMKPEASPPWNDLARSLRYVAKGPYNPAVEFTMPSHFVPRLEVLRDYATPSFPAGRPVAVGALDLMHRLHADFEYRSASTQIDTPLLKAFNQRAGVCQDFAHLMAGALRMLGLPVRYVSGYLLTRGPDDGAALVGADASHAWVQVYCPSTPGVPGDWLDLDPTNDLVPGSGHVRLAVGRDFGDVTPLRGVIRGGGRHTLKVAVRTRVLGSGPALATGPVEETP